MKQIFNNWRIFLKEEAFSSSAISTGQFGKASSSSPVNKNNMSVAVPNNLGVAVSFNPGYTISLALINLNAIRESLFPETELSQQQFIQALKDPEMINKAAIGYIFAMYNPMLSKAHPQMGGSGGSCSDSYSVRRSIGRGLGESLYNALLGFCAENNLYLTPDRHSLSPGAKKRWSKIDNQTNDELPKPGVGPDNIFDKFGQRQTPELDDDCLIHGEPSLDKAYKDDSQVSFFNALKSNIDKFFKDDIEPRLSEPGFLQRLFGVSKSSQMEKVKKQIIKQGQKKFHEWDWDPKKSQEKWAASKKT